MTTFKKTTLGGAAMARDGVAWKVALSDIDLGEEEERAVVEVLRSKWLTQGPRVAEFERRFAEAVAAPYAVAVSNCTAALHLALLAVGVRPGDEVIVPALTFVATANAVLFCGATPVFADIVDAESLVMAPADVECKVTPRTRAIVPMHYGGYPCDLHALAEIAQQHGLEVVEDAAHAPGAAWRGQKIGALSRATCFSFFGNKNLVTGEGGMVTTSDAGVAEFVRLHRTHGMTATSLDKISGHAFSYDVLATGYNYRLTELQAALGLAQLQKLERNNDIRRRLAGIYRERLNQISELTVPFVGRDAESACHLFCVLLPPTVNRPRVQRLMKDRGVQTSIHYPPVHRFTSFQGRFSADVPKLEAISARMLTLPLHPLMTPQDVHVVCDTLEEALEA
ncbi:MAG: DegT/DnrJ/EryC1/StrS family aminotransferase [Gemmatimonadota bacterium]